jgi:hypothetical protein
MCYIDDDLHELHGVRLTKHLIHHTQRHQHHHEHSVMSHQRNTGTRCVLKVADRPNLSLCVVWAIAGYIHNLGRPDARYVHSWSKRSGTTRSFRPQGIIPAMFHLTPRRRRPLSRASTTKSRRSLRSPQDREVIAPDGTPSG